MQLLAPVGMSCAENATPFEEKREYKKSGSVTLTGFLLRLTHQI